MNKTTARLRTIFLTGFDKEPYLIQLKANALMYFDLVFLVIVFCLSFALSRVPQGSLNHRAAYVLMVLTGLTCIVSLVLLKKGSYHAAANTLVSLLILLITSGLMNKIRLNPQTGYTSYIYFMFPHLVVVGLFCTRRWLLFSSAFFAVAVSVFHTLAYMQGGFSHEGQAAAALVLFLFSIAITSTLTYLVVTIGEKTIAKSEFLAGELSTLADSLEIKVDERTEELNTAIDEMKSMNESLIAARDALWGEMQLAKKIQTVLLPEQPEIEGFEISTCMIPTDDVGGDYYDIINVGGRYWLVIGDVSGHGVPAGLIMMMVQTAIHTAISDEPDQKPEYLLSRINKVITQNIRRLNDDKYMTITVLAYFNNGHFYFSGLHQDIMIFRSATGSVELVETNGMWIGIVEDIHGMLHDEELLLKKGDVMLLYTDGITEAWRKNSIQDHRDPKFDMFGGERLRSCFASIGDRQPDLIRQGILDALVDYNLTDDITLVIVKKL